MNDVHIDALIQATQHLHDKDFTSAKQVLNANYPFKPIKSEGRNYTAKQMIAQFFSDGFIDRYSGKRLVNPGMLRIISELLPDTFPYHPHWKTDQCHMAYWDYQPTVDHIYPVSLGGKDAPENWATTSMVNNSAKSNFTLDQLGWTLKDQGDIRDWDGLSKMFVNLVDQNPRFLLIGRIKDYYIATKEIIEEINL